MANLLHNLSQSGTKPAVLSLIPEFLEKYLLKASLVIFPTPLASLYQSDFLELNYDDLLTQCKSVLVNVNQEIANVVEQETRTQSHSKLWFKYNCVT